jgi:BirA family biotin operon repressor/biotin-[acetyl-CoA-carboxylase] ligase
MNVSSQILRHLRAAASPVSAIASQCGVSIDKVRMEIGQLQAAGFVFEQHPTLGCSLISCPDRLIADDIFSRLESSWVQEILVFEKTSSTNDRAMELGNSGCKTPAVVLAEAQTAGRGRFGRVWESARNEGVWFSLVFHPQIPAHQWTRLPGAAALAAARSLEDAGAKQVGVKWPNDLQINERKVAGILVETGSHLKNGPFAVIGIGINVNQTGFSKTLSPKATSLKKETGVHVDRTQLTVRLIFHLENVLQSVPFQHASLIQELRERSTLIGKLVCFETPERVASQGMAVDLNDEGLLVVQTQDGGFRTLNAGEVSLSCVV